MAAVTWLWLCPSGQGGHVSIPSGVWCFPPPHPPWGCPRCPHTLCAIPALLQLPGTALAGGSWYTSLPGGHLCLRRRSLLPPVLWEPLGVPRALSLRCHLCCRAVRALCDHTGTADGHLSFQKGDVLELLSTVDEDWIRCCHGNSTGLVPVGYTSLIL
uniref:SH3 domain-containing protein n=1 Tax=Catharus ustulatus TaxID=91951 RepID=A0A8C3UHE8_CATUS